MSCLRFRDIHTFIVAFTQAWRDWQEAQPDGQKVARKNARLLLPADFFGEWIDHINGRHTWVGAPEPGWEENFTPHGFRAERREALRRPVFVYVEDGIERILATFERVP